MLSFNLMNTQRGPGWHQQAERAGAAAMTAAFCSVDHQPLAQSEIEILWMAVYDKAHTIALKPADPVADVAFGQLGTPFDILRGISAGHGESSWHQGFAFMYDNQAERNEE